VSTKDALRRADALLRDGQASEAVAIYESVATSFERAGSALKAVALSKQIVDITTPMAPDLAQARSTALQRLARLYAELGLNAEALAAERLLGALSDDRRH
jgi:hypothetical protein